MKALFNFRIFKMDQIPKEDLEEMEMEEAFNSVDEGSGNYELDIKIDDIKRNFNIQLGIRLY